MEWNDNNCTIILQRGIQGKTFLIEGLPNLSEKVAKWIENLQKLKINFDLHKTKWASNFRNFVFGWIFKFILPVRLIVEFAVDVFAEEGRSNLRDELLRDQVEPTLESVAHLYAALECGQLDAAARIRRQERLRVDFHVDFTAGQFLVFGRDRGDDTADKVLVGFPNAKDDVLLQKLKSKVKFKTE